MNEMNENELFTKNIFTLNTFTNYSILKIYVFEMMSGLLFDWRTNPDDTLKMHCLPHRECDVCFSDVTAVWRPVDEPA